MMKRSDTLKHTAKITNTKVMSNPALIQALSSLPCFRNVPESALRALADVCPVRSFETRDTVLDQGSTAGAAYLIVTGMLEVSVETRRTWHHIATLQPGEIAGESALFIHDVPRNATVLAHKPSQCLELTPQTMKRLAGNPAVTALELSLIAALSRRIRRTNLEIQAAWKETQPNTAQEDAAEPRGTFAGKLRTMFKGRGANG